MRLRGKKLTVRIKLKHILIILFMFLFIISGSLIIIGLWSPIKDIEIRNIFNSSLRFDILNTTFMTKIQYQTDEIDFVENKPIQTSIYVRAYCEDENVKELLMNTKNVSFVVTFYEAYGERSKTIFFGPFSNINFVGNEAIKTVTTNIYFRHPGSYGFFVYFFHYLY